MIELMFLITITVTITGLLLAAVIEAALAADRRLQPRDDGRVASRGHGGDEQVDEVMVDAAYPTRSRSRTS
jgi:hypothetical protein